MSFWTAGAQVNNPGRLARSREVLPRDTVIGEPTELRAVLSAARQVMPGRKLVAHWLVREQIKAGYAEPGGLALQRALGWVMRRHIDGSIPRALMAGETEAAWDPEAFGQIDDGA